MALGKMGSYQMIVQNKHVYGVETSLTYIHPLQAKFLYKHRYENLKCMECRGMWTLRSTIFY